MCPTALAKLPDILSKEPGGSIARWASERPSISQLFEIEQKKGYVSSRVAFKLQNISLRYSSLPQHLSKAQYAFFSVLYKHMPLTQ